MPGCRVDPSALGDQAEEAAHFRNTRRLERTGRGASRCRHNSGSGLEDRFPPTGRALVRLLSAQEEVRIRSASQQTSANKMDDFEFVAGMESSFGPCRAGNDLQVKFDSYTIGLHAEVVD